MRASDRDKKKGKGQVCQNKKLSLGIWGLGWDWWSEHDNWWYRLHSCVLQLREWENIKNRTLKRKRWRGKGGRWRWSWSWTGFPPSHKWRVVLEASVCPGCYHAHFVLCNDSFIQGDMHLALQGQSASAPTSFLPFTLCVLVLLSNLTFSAFLDAQYVCVCVCVC